MVYGWTDHKAGRSGDTGLKTDGFIIAHPETCGASASTVHD